MISRLADVVRCAVILSVLLGWTAQPSRAAGLAEQIESANFGGKSPPPNSVSPLTVKLQVLLDRAHFSPGEIDGKLGENAKKALRAFAEASGLQGKIELSQEVWQKLATDAKSVLTQYAMTDADVRGPFLAKLPAKLEDMKDLPRLNFTSPREAVAEKFHISEPLLSALNPGQKFDAAGATIVVPDVASDMPQGSVARLEVDKIRQTVKALDRANNLVAFYPATVGSEDKPSPSGTLKVTDVTKNPTYHYNPAYHFKHVKSDRPFEIKPGPNNPVGTRWIGLNGEGYGIHGTANPGNISKAESHGCVRLTNWDVEQLAQLVKRGTPVTFVEGKS